MTQEEKNLLLKDICARLPYCVKLKVGNDALSLDMFRFDNGLYKTIEKIITAGYKMYLRPMSSMTEEEKGQRRNILTHEAMLEFEDVEEYVDWLLEHHFDYRGLIEKGLALEAPEGMYEIVPTSI